MTGRERERVDVRVRGRVHGVGYRYSALQEAQRLGLSGEVRNLPDGEVAVVAEGERWALEELVAWCRRGPPAARVDDLDARWSPARGEFRTFSVVR